MSTARTRRDSLPVNGSPRLAKILDMCFSTVRGVTTSLSAMPGSSGSRPRRSVGAAGKIARRALGRATSTHHPSLGVSARHGIASLT